MTIIWPSWALSYSTYLPVQFRASRVVGLLNSLNAVRISLSTASANYVHPNEIFCNAGTSGLFPHGLRYATRSRICPRCRTASRHSLLRPMHKSNGFFMLPEKLTASIKPEPYLAKSIYSLPGFIFIASIKSFCPTRYVFSAILPIYLSV